MREGAPHYDKKKRWRHALHRIIRNLAEGRGLIDQDEMSRPLAIAE